MITNHPQFEAGRLVAWTDLRRPPVKRAVLYRPTEAWTYSHHAHLTVFDGRLLAIWSNGHRDEDAPGQRVLLSSADDFARWSEPRVLMVPGRMADGTERVLTAGGWHQHEGRLVAYAGDYGPHKESTRLIARTTTDGDAWDDACDLGIPVCPNHGPQPTASGRLILAGNIAFPYTDDPAGLTGWEMAGIYPPGLETSDDPEAFWPVAATQNWPTALCEGAFYETDDRVIHLLLRATGEHCPRRLWLTESRDDGESWSAPVETPFTNQDAKFHFGRLPDGRFYWVGNPLPGDRCPLVLSLSDDGASFDQHYVLGEEPWAMSRPGRWKGGEYGYPHSLVYGPHLYVIVSRQKEGIEVLRVSLGAL